VSGTVSNLAFLLVVGVAAEPVTSRPRWPLSDLGVGVTGQVFGYLWQPLGSGNSVAVCGLAGILALRSTPVRRPDPAPWPRRSGAVARRACWQMSHSFSSGGLARMPS
jgi:hypothetical protein